MGSLPCFYFFYFSWSLWELFFWQIFDFFQDFDFAAPFLAFLGQKLSWREVLVLFRMLTYWSSQLSLFEPSLLYKRIIFFSFYYENQQKTEKLGKNPARKVFPISDVTQAYKRVGSLSLGFYITLIHYLCENTFYLHRHRLLSQWEWKLLNELEKILHRKTRFWAFFAVYVQILNFSGPPGCLKLWFSSSTLKHCSFAINASKLVKNWRNQIFFRGRAT